VKPVQDNVAALKEYAADNKINSQQWLLLTGNQTEIYNLARTSYFAEEEPGFSKTSNDFLHTEHAILVDRKGRIRGVYNATLKLEIKRMTEDIHILLQEKN
jgi:protein SCO1/2